MTSRRLRTATAISVFFGDRASQYALVLWKRLSSLPDLGQISSEIQGRYMEGYRGRFMKTESLLLHSRPPSEKAAGAVSAVATRSLF